MRRAGLWAAVAVLLAGGTGWAADIAVNVKETFAKPATVTTLSLREIRAKSNHKTENVTGLTRTQFSAQVSARFNIEQSGGSFCVTSATADVGVGYDRVTIYIPREFARGSCQHEAVLKHEQKHVTAAREILRQVAPQVSRTVKDAFRNGGPRYCGVTAERARDAAMKAVESGLVRIKSRAADLGESIHGDVDTPDEYLSVSRSCPSWPDH